MPRIVLPRSLAHTLRIEVCECIQLRIEPFDLLNVRFG
jgi:hypothetical protein